MNVALIGHGFWPLVGGLERQLYDLAAGLARRGCQVRVLSIVGQRGDLPAEEVLHLPDGAAIRVHRAPVPPPPAPRDPLQDPEIPAQAYRRLAPRWARLLAGDDVLCTFGASPALAGAVLKERLGLPFVAVLPGIPVHADSRFCDVLACGADLFVGVSRFMTARARDLYDLQMVTVYNGIDTDFFRPSADPLPYAFLRGLPGPLVTAPVRLDPAKGLDLLLEAFELVVALRPDATLLVTGNGSICHHLGLTNPYYDYLRGLVDLKELGPRVIFARGAISSRDMPALYSRSDLCVMTSASEGFGLGLAESLACQTPVVATRTEGMAEVFTDGMGGLYVDRRDPVDVAQAILTLLESRDLRLRLGRLGREHILRTFPAQRQADRYLELFTSLSAARQAA